MDIIQTAANAKPDSDGYTDLRTAVCSTYTHECNS